MRKLIPVLFLLAMTSCASMSGTKAPADPLDKLGWKLGCQAYTFRAMSLFETIDTLKRLDIHYIELYPGQRFAKDIPSRADHNMTDAMIARLREKLAECDVHAMSYGVVELTGDNAHDRKVFEFARKMGMKNIVSEPPEQALPAVDNMAREYGIHVAIHDHPKPSHYWNCDTVASAIKDRSKMIGACADVGHWYRSGLTPVECLKKLEGRIIELHFKDINENKEDVPWGQGHVDVVACMKELKRQNFHGLFAIEYERTTGEELIDNVSKSIAFFKQQAAELEKD